MPPFPVQRNFVHATNTRLIVFKFLVKSSFSIALYYQVSEIRIAGNTDDVAGGWMSGIRLCDEQTDSDNDQNAQVLLTVIRIL